VIVAAQSKGAVVIVVVPSEAASAQLPAIDLTAVTVATALESIQWVFQSSRDIQARVSDFGNPDEQSLSFALEIARSWMTTSQGPIFPGASIAPDNSVSLETYSIRDLTESLGNGNAAQGAERVIAAIDAAFSLDNSGQEPAKIVLHPDTSLLIMRGTRDQIEIAGDVIGRLSSDAQRAREKQDEEDRMMTALDDLAFQSQSSLQSLIDRRDMVRERLDGAQKALDRIEELAKAGHAGEGELITHRDAVRVMRSELQEIGLEITETERELDRIEASRASIIDKYTQASATSEVSLQVTYKLNELQPYSADLAAAIAAVAGSSARVSGPVAVDVGSGTIVVDAPERGQRAAIALINLARKLKAGDPNLPTMSVEEMLKGAGSRQPVQENTPRQSPR
jgi:hypothetical protein